MEVETSLRLHQQVLAIAIVVCATRLTKAQVQGLIKAVDQSRALMELKTGFTPQVDELEEAAVRIFMGRIHRME